MLVTGADGFAGRAVCAALSGEGFKVRAGVRRSGNLLPRLPCDNGVVIGDIGSETAWAEALADIDVVVHLAGRAHVLRETFKDPQAEFSRVNTRGTERLALAAAEAGVGRLIFVSSIGVNGRVTSGHPFVEEHPPTPHNAYAFSKWEAEEALRRIAARTGLGAVVLRPPLMYGPHVKANFLRMLKIVDRGLPLPLGSVNNLRSMLYVRNLADAIVACIEHPKAVGETFLISDGEDVSTPELIRRIAHALGRPARLMPSPPRLLRTAFNLAGKSAMAEQLLDSLVVDSSKIRRVLGWRPPYMLDDGLRETAVWFKNGQKGE